MRRPWLAGALTGLAAVAATLAFGRALSAQGAAPATGRIAVVNVVKVLNEYQRQKDLVEEIAAIQEKLAAENKTRRDKLDTLQAELDRMDPDDPLLVQRLREMLGLQVEYKNWGETAQLNVAREYGVWSIRLYQELLGAVEELAKREGYDLVLYRGEFERVSTDPEQIKEQIRSLHVLYSNTGIDITPAVLEKLNVRYRAEPRRQMLQTP